MQHDALSADEIELGPSGPARPLPDVPVQTVGQIVSGRLLTCPPATPVAEAARLMRENHCSSIVIVADGVPAGIWTEQDALALDFDRPGAFDRPVGEVMTPSVKSIDAAAAVHVAGLRFRRENIRHLLVVDPDGLPLGMLSQTDVVANHGVEHYLTFRDVRSVLSRTPIILPADLPLGEAVRRIRADGGEAAIVTAPDWGEAGILTERDIVRAVAERRGGTVGEIANRPVVTVHPNSTLLSARNLFAERGFRHLAVQDETGAFVGLLCFSDILAILQHEYLAQLNSALCERDEALIRSRKDLHLARQVIEATLDGVMIIDEAARIEYVNPAFTRLTGYEPGEVIGHNPRLLSSGRQTPEFYAKMWRDLVEIGHWQGEIWNRRKDGSIFAEWLTINSIRGDDGRISKFAAIFSDITEKKRKEELVQNLAYYDALTQLPNRRRLTEQLRQAMANAHRHGGRLALMFLDLDLFKRINDTLGHDVGDAVLIEVAGRLVRCLREGDMVARLGGDEFVVLMPELKDDADAARLASRIIVSVRAPFHVGERELSVSTSVGIAVYPEDGDDVEVLLKSADSAMYQAKQLGRNTYQLHSLPMNALSAKKLAMERHVADAVANGEMRLAYQVKVDLNSGAVCGAEALIRWSHPELGVVSPAEFIPVVERLGLMPELGEWVLRSACRQNRRWMDQGLPHVRMAVNLSARQFLKGNLAETVIAVLAESGLPPHLLELELTEGTIISYPAEVRRALDQLHAAGVRIVIDDFGTRHSSLTVLSQMPIDALKIDQVFIDGLGQAFEQKDIIGAIIRLAHALGIRAVAENVEHLHQVEVLKEAGCDEIQGYLIGRAVSPEDLETLFHQRLLPL